MGDRELAEDTGLARSAYMSSESTLCTELLLEVALDTEETLLTLRDLDTKHSCAPQPHADCKMAGLQADGRGMSLGLVFTQFPCFWNTHQEQETSGDFQRYYTMKGNPVS